MEMLPSGQTAADEWSRGQFGDDGPVGPASVSIASAMTMIVQRLRIRGFKGIDCELEWAPVVVVFGKNDAGKSNLLEAVQTLFLGPRTQTADGVRATHLAEQTQELNLE